MARPSEDNPYRLLVEGSDDKHSVINLMARHGFNWDNEDTIRPYVSSEGGVPRLLAAFPVVLKGTYSRVGIILDSDLSLAVRWAQIRDRARKVDVDLPASPEPEGTVVPGRLPDSLFGVWLMPDNSSPGTLENFLGKLAPADNPCWVYADEAVREARRRGAPCQEKDHAKSLLHTWLAWQEEPGLPFGTALKSEYFGKDSDEANRFVSWFRRLFVEF
jgi:hypothetical protein